MDTQVKIKPGKGEKPEAHDGQRYVGMHHGYGRREYQPVPQGPVFKPGKFGRMFPELPPMVADTAALDALAAAMLDANGDQSGDNPGVPAGFTYFGQFVDHDVTFDPTTMPEVAIDPQTVFNFRTPKLELDNLYGSGPDLDPFLYQPDDPALFAMGSTGQGQGDPALPVGFPNDLPRFNKIALIGDPRNDENLAVAQTHLAFLKFHNKIVAVLRADGTPAAQLFDAARKLTTWHYQKIVLEDFIGRLVDPAVMADVRQNGRKFFLFADEPFIPVEFSVGAYRLGHSMVRQFYNFNRVFRFGGVTPASLALLFRFTRLSGGGADVPVPSDWIIDWRRFYDFGAAGVDVNPTRRIDPFLVQELHTLPAGGGSLPQRNLTRGLRMGLPSGQAVAARIGVAPLTPAEIGGGPDGQVATAQGFAQQTPLWYYILKEALVQQDGLRLGQVGSRIVSEVFVGMLEGDPNSFLAQDPTWIPTLPRANNDTFTMVDMLTVVDEINPIN